MLVGPWRGCRTHAIAMYEGPSRPPRARGGRMPTVAERVADAVAPVLDEQGLLLHDLEHSGTSIRVVIDRADVEGGRGLDVDALAAATRAISRLLDELDPIDGHYTLEVSSPGLERPLRTPAHFARA